LYPPRQQNARYSTSQRQHETFGKELANQPDSSRSQRAAQCDLFGAARCARQGQVGHVGTRNQEDKTNGSQKHPQSVAHAAHQMHLQRLKRRHRIRRIGRRILPHQVRHDAVQLADA